MNAPDSHMKCIRPPEGQAAPALGHAQRAPPVDTTGTDSHAIRAHPRHPRFQSAFPFASIAVHSRFQFAVLLADAEAGEDAVQQFLFIDATRNPPQMLQSAAQEGGRQVKRGIGTVHAGHRIIHRFRTSGEPLPMSLRNNDL